LKQRKADVSLLFLQILGICETSDIECIFKELKRNDVDLFIRWFKKTSSNEHLIDEWYRQYENTRDFSTELFNLRKLALRVMLHRKTDDLNNTENINPDVQECLQIQYLIYRYDFNFLVSDNMNAQRPSWPDIDCLNFSGSSDFSNTLKVSDSLETLRVNWPEF
jgi:hypothetical protein